MNFSFGSPYFLLLLLLVPCFVWCKTHRRTYYLSPVEWVKSESGIWRIELWLKILLFSLMVIALAEPFLYDSSNNKQKRGRDLILTIDASGSMAERGFDKDTKSLSKFDTTIELSKAFIAKRHDDNIGAVIFGTFAYSASPLTYDLFALSYMHSLTDVGIAGESTAIGDAIMQSIRTLSYGTATQKAIILLTDGYHNAGVTSPQQAVKEAKKQAIKIYTIGIGKSSSYDKALLETIAKESNAKSYSATTADELTKIYQSIEKLEPSPIRSENFLGRHQLFGYILFLIFTLLFAWVAWKRREMS